MSKLGFSVNELMESCTALQSKRKFTPGFDKMTPKAAEIWLGVHGEELCDQLNGGKYNVMPAVGFNVAKANGGYRRFVKLTAIDSIVQMTALEKLAPYCEAKFSDSSFAYRKGCGVGSALEKYCAHASVFPFAARIDLKTCFDSIDFAVLENALYSFFFDRKVVSLLMAFAKMPVIEDGRIADRKKGILQGSPVSGLLCNIYLHGMDTELKSRNIPFVRYADDLVLFAADRNAANEFHNFACSFLHKKLRLTVNAEKSCVDASEKLTFLGSVFIRNKENSVTVCSGEKPASVFYNWYAEKPVNHRNSMDILSDGILRQKDYSAIFDCEAVKTDIPLQVLERINIFSNVILDSRFLETAMRAGVFVNVFGRDYRYIGRFTPSGPLKDAGLIFEQLCAYNNPLERLALAKEFDLASIHNLRLNIRYHNKQKEADAYTRALSMINRLYVKMKEVDSYEKLLLLEAQIRGLYYGCFDTFCSNADFRFERRSKQPPLNEINSMISFGNVVLYNYIATEIYKSALDIRVGFLHATNRREESLNLDIAEIFRPLIVDRVVFTLINRRAVKLSHFYSNENGGVYLNEDGKRIFLREFYEKINSTVTIGNKTYSYAALIGQEIRKLVKRFRNGEKYKAYRQVR